MTLIAMLLAASLFLTAVMMGGVIYQLRADLFDAEREIERLTDDARFLETQLRGVKE